MSGHSEWALRVFQQINRWPRTMARRLFPTQPHGHVRATRTLAEMARSTALAMDLRVRGAISQALAHEDAADAAYGRLPAWAKDHGDAISVYAEEPFSVLWTRGR